MTISSLRPVVGLAVNITPEMSEATKSWIITAIAKEHSRFCLAKYVMARSDHKDAQHSRTFSGSSLGSVIPRNVSIDLEMRLIVNPPRWLMISLPVLPKHNGSGCCSRRRSSYLVVGPRSARFGVSLELLEPGRLSGLPEATPCDDLTRSDRRESVVMQHQRGTGNPRCAIRAS